MSHGELFVEGAPILAIGMAACAFVWAVVRSRTSARMALADGLDSGAPASAPLELEMPAPMTAAAPVISQEIDPDLLVAIQAAIHHHRTRGC